MLPNIRLACKLAVRDRTDMEERPEHTGDLHDSPFPNEHNLILRYPPGVIHQSLCAVRDSHQPPEHPQRLLEVAKRRHLLDALPEAAVELAHGRLDGLVIGVGEEFVEEPRRRRGTRGRGRVERVGGLGQEEDEQLGGGVGRVVRRREGVGVPGDDAGVGEDEAAEVRDGGGEARAEGGVADGGDLAGLVGGAAEGGDEVGEGGGGPGGLVREGEAVDEEALGGVAEGEERARLGEELGGGELEVGDGRVGRGGRGEGDEEDLARDDVLHLVGRPLRPRRRGRGRHRRWGCGREGCCFDFDL